MLEGMPNTPDEVSNFIDHIVEFGPEDAMIDSVRYAFSLGSRVTVLNPSQAMAMTIRFADNKVSAKDRQLWARFLLGRRDVVFREPFEWDILEFLEDWSFADAEHSIATSIPEWQWRFGQM
jgi:hypothetical protein